MLLRDLVGAFERAACVADGVVVVQVAPKELIVRHGVIKNNAAL